MIVKEYKNSGSLDNYMNKHYEKYKSYNTSSHKDDKICFELAYKDAKDNDLIIIPRHWTKWFEVCLMSLGIER